MVFETEDLENATPAIVSRMGMLYMQFEDMGKEVLWRAWL
jgi:dynein heavy chain